MRFPRLVLVMWLLFVGPAVAGTVHPIVILHTNDFHGHLEPFTDKDMVPPPATVGGAAYLAGLVRDLRARYPQALLLDGGDIAQGTPISNLFFGMPVVEFMNQMHYDARTIGNHEFDWGVTRLETMIHASQAPIICANLVRASDGRMLDGVRPYLIKRVNGVTIGLLGLVTTDTPMMSFPDNVKPVRFLDYAPIVRHYLPLMRHDGAQMIVLLTHLGVDDDTRLAQAVPQIDAIVGAHSHTALFTPKLVGHTVIVQAGCYGRYVGVLHLDYDVAAHRVTHYTDHDELARVLPANIQPVAAVADLVQRYHSKVGTRLNRPVGSLSEDLAVQPHDVDSPLGNVVTDALREDGAADISIYNSGGIRSPLLSGVVHWGDVYTTLPFENHVVTLDVTGQALIDVINQCLQKGVGLMQVSGMTYAYSPETHEVRDIKVGGIPLDPSKTYTVATIDFLYLGGDGYTALKTATHPKYGRLARDVLVEYLTRHPALKAPEGGRIHVLTPSGTQSNPGLEGVPGRP